MQAAARRPLRVLPALVLAGTLAGTALLSCSSVTPENTFESPAPGATSTLTYTQTPSWSASTPTVTPPILEFPGLSPGETPVIVKGIVNTLDPTLNVYAGPGHDFPLLGTLNNKAVVDVLGRSENGWLYISYPEPGAELTGWVAALSVLVEKADANQIDLVQIVTLTVPPFLP